MVARQSELIHLVMNTPSNFPFELRTQKQVLVATFASRKDAKECRRQLEIGCIANSLASNKGRVIEKESGVFAVYAIV
jgi:hypothetical protein